MKIGIIGAGHIGGTLAKHFVDAGHGVAVSNSRGPETLAGLVEELGQRVQAYRFSSSCASQQPDLPLPLSNSRADVGETTPN